MIEDGCDIDEDVDSDNTDEPDVEREDGDTIDIAILDDADDMDVGPIDDAAEGRIVEIRDDIEGSYAVEREDVDMTEGGEYFADVVGGKARPCLVR